MPRFLSKAFQTKQLAKPGDQAPEDEGSHNTQGINDGSSLNDEN